MVRALCLFQSRYICCQLHRISDENTMSTSALNCWIRVHLWTGNSLSSNSLRSQHTSLIDAEWHYFHSENVNKYLFVFYSVSFPLQDILDLCCFKKCKFLKSFLLGVEKKFLCVTRSRPDEWIQSLTNSHFHSFHGNTIHSAVQQPTAAPTNLPHRPKPAIITALCVLFCFSSSLN